MAFELVELDTGSTLEITAKNRVTLAALDLTGFTSVLLRYVVGSSAIQEKTMTIDPDQVTNIGKASYKFLTDELIAGGGSFIAEIRLTDGSGLVLTSTENIVRSVKARLAA